MGVTPFTGVVVKTQTTNGVVMGANSRAITAGMGDIWIKIDGARMLSVNDRQKRRDTSPISKSASSWWVVDQVEQMRRRLQGGCPSDLLGDINMDCSFDVADLNFLQRYLINEKLNFKDKGRQLKTMDFDGKGTIDAKDANMVLLTLAKKYRFLSSYELTFKKCLATFKITLKNSLSELLVNPKLTKVHLEVAAPASTANGKIRAGSASTTTSSSSSPSKTSVVMSMTGPVAGVFTANFMLQEASSLEFVVLVETYTDKGVTSTERRFPWYGTEYGKFGAVDGYSWDPLFKRTVSSSECVNPGDTCQALPQNNCGKGESDGLCVWVGGGNTGRCSVASTDSPTQTPTSWPSFAPTISSAPTSSPTHSVCYTNGEGTAPQGERCGFPLSIKASRIQAACRSLTTLLVLKIGVCGAWDRLGRL